MEPSESLFPGTAVVDGNKLDPIRGARLDHRTLELSLIDNSALRIYTFNSLMLPIEAKRTGVETYEFFGPKLGIYHDTADLREGPFVNHFIRKLKIEISYLSKAEATIILIGEADLSESNVDPYWYKGSKSGAWNFEATFLYRFKTIF